MKDIYNDNTYLKNNPSWHEEDAPFKAGEILKLLKPLADTVKTVCEIGCGTGEILVQLSRSLPQHIQFYGFDISQQAIEIAKTKETERLHCNCKNLAESNESNLFDVLLVIDVIEHIDNYFSFLNGIANKGKYTIFHIPLDMSVWALFREKMLIESKQRVGHIHNFSEDFIKSILNDYGFKIIAQLYTPPTFETVSVKQKTINGLRKLLFRINKRFASKLMGGYSIMLLTENNAAGS